MKSSRLRAGGLKPSKLILSLALSALLINQFVVDPIAREVFGLRTGVGLEEPNAFVAFLSSLLILGILILGARGVEKVLKALSQNEEGLRKAFELIAQRIPMGSFIFKILKAIAFKRR